MAGSAFAQSSTHGLMIPAGNPVPLYWTPARLAAAQARYAASPSNYPLVGSVPEMRALHQAFLYKMTGNFTAANGGTIDTTGDAVSWAVNTSFYDPTQAGNNGARWYGEAKILVFNWVYDRFSATERNAVTTDLNRSIAADLTKRYGSNGDGNHAWGYLRNAILWGVSSYNMPFTMTSADCSWDSPENGFPLDICNMSQRQIAETLLDEAFDRRWVNLMNMLNTDADGGMPPDGTQYGKYLLDYMTMPMIVGADYGRPLITESNFWVEAAYLVLYGTTPRPTFHTNSRLTHYQRFSTGDSDEQAGNGSTPAVSNDVGHFLTYVVTYFNGTPLENFVRKWLTDLNPPRVSYLKVMDGEIGAPGAPLTTLPLDYYAPGPGHLYLRDVWGANEPTVMLLQLGRVRGNHTHCDAGSFQVLRNDRWVSKEAATYQQGLTNATGSGSVSGSRVWGTNSVTVNNHDGGPACFDTLAPPPNILRMDRTATHAFGAVDLRQYLGVPATSLIREFVYVREMNALVTFDRASTTSAATPKTTLVHCPVAPTQQANIFTCTNGNEMFRTIHLSGSVAGQTVAYRSIDERTSDADCPSASCDPQHRIQAAVTGTANSYLVNAMQSLGSGDAQMTASLTENTNSIVVTLSLGAQNAVVTFAKGMTSSGGSISINGASSAFSNQIDRPTATTAGVTWDGSGGGGGVGGPTAPSGLRIERP